MKKAIYLITLFLLLCSFVYAELSPEDKADIDSKMQIIQESVTNDGLDRIYEIISPDADPELKEGIKERFEDKFSTYNLSDYEYEEFGGGRVKVHAKYALKTESSYTTSGHWFLFVKSDQGWLLKDSDFHKSLTGIIFGVVGVMGIIFVVLLASYIFWLIMLLDAVTKKFDSKVMWIIILVITGVSGFGLISALVYFFSVRKKLVQQNKQLEQNTQQQN